MLNINNLRLTEEDFVRCTQRSPIEAQLDKALRGVVDWLKALEEGDVLDAMRQHRVHRGHGMGVAADLLEEALEQANLERLTDTPAAPSTSEAPR